MKLSKESIKTWIANHAAAEFETDHIDYYLHITDSGDIVNGVSEADASFICRLSPEDFGLTQEQYDNSENPEAVYEHEIDGDPIYEHIISSLYTQAIKYLEDLEE